MGFAPDPVNPSLTMFAIAPSDAQNLVSAVRQIYVGNGGNVALTDMTGNTVVHQNVASGSYLGPFTVIAVPSSGTTASGLIGYV
jgi:hypothetical protein